MGEVIPAPKRKRTRRNYQAEIAAIDQYCRMKIEILEETSETSDHMVGKVEGLKQVVAKIEALAKGLR